MTRSRNQKSEILPNAVIQIDFFAFWSENTRIFDNDVFNANYVFTKVLSEYYFFHYLKLGIADIFEEITSSSLMRYKITAVITVCCPACVQL